MRLWLVRHARPLVDAGVCYGATDVLADPVATLGAATALAAVLPKGLPVMCSPLQRCTQLAEALQALRHDLAYKVDPRLTEMNFGCWEGWRWSDIGREEIAHWTAAFNSYRFGGQESVGELMARVACARDDASRCGEAVWITHAGVIRATSLLVRGVLRVGRASQWPQEVHGFGQWQCLEP